MRKPKIRRDATPPPRRRQRRGGLGRIIDSDVARRGGLLCPDTLYSRSAQKWRIGADRDCRASCDFVPGRSTVSADPGHPSLDFRAAAERDHGRVVAAIADWWETPNAATLPLLMPRLFFQHFRDTSTIVEDERGELAAFLVGFRSQSQPGVAYLHFVGVRPDLRRSGLARTLYERFFAQMRASGCHRVDAITGPGNRDRRRSTGRWGSSSAATPRSTTCRRTSTTTAPASTGSRSPARSERALRESFAGVPQSRT